MSEPVRPDIVTDEHLAFLDDLRTSGVTNMFGAGAYLEAEFGLERKEARGILSYWMKSFEQRGCPKGTGEFTFREARTELNIGYLRRKRTKRTRRGIV